MTEIKIKGVPTYTIPLDSLDLAYLENYFHTPRAEKMPLWTKKRLDGESEYCQVQIVRAHYNEECYSEDTIETTNCHVCNVEVPVTCYKEHTESEQHVILENIFQSILERLSKQLKITIIHNGNSIDKDQLYHCVPCSKIIKIDNKQRHEMSRYHIRSQKELSIVKEFYRIFKKENQVNSNDVEGVENEEIVDEESALCEKNIGTEQIKTIHNGVSESVQDICSNDETNTVCSSNDYTTKLTTNDNMVSSSFEEYYFKQIIKKHDLKVDLPIIDGDFVHVANPSGMKLKILRENFHSFTSRSQYIYCQLCDSVFQPEEKNDHKVTGRHARNIFIQVNEHFARMLCNNYWSHCLICNEVYQTAYLSKHGLVHENHIRTLKKSIISDVFQNNEETNTATVSAIEHARSGKRESGERRMVEFIDEDKQQTKSEKLNNENNIYKSKENKVKYSDNKEYFDVINMSGDELDDHMSDKNHIEKTKEVSPIQKVVLCELCNVTVPKDQIEYHNAGTTHWSNAVKKIFTSFTLGLQAYLSEDKTKSSDTSEKPKDKTKNENANKHDEAKGDENPSKNNNAINNENAVTEGENTMAIDQNTTTKDENATTKDENATTKDENAITEDENTINKDENAITEDKNIITKNENAITEDDNSITKDENVIIEDENAIAKDENTIIEDENTTTKDENVITEDENAIVKDENTIISDENKITKDENAITEDKNTITKDENTITKDENAITEDKNITSTSISNGDIAPPDPFRIADSTKTKVTCVVCDIDIYNTQLSIDAHKNSSKHELCVREILRFHSIKRSYNYFNFNINNKLNAEFLFCESCNINVTDIWEHIKTEKHTALLQLEFEISIESLKTFVYKCKGRYSKASKFREYYKMLLKTNKVDKLSKSHYCTLCKLKLFEEGSEIEHMLSAEHEMKLAKIFKSRQT